MDNTSARVAQGVDDAELNHPLAKIVPTVPAALKALGAMERQLSAASTYDKIRRIKKEAEILKTLMGHVAEVKNAAELVILEANARIGDELAKVPKARGPGGKKGTKSKTAITPKGKSTTGVAGTSRSRLQNLAKIPAAERKAIARKLQAAGKDATMKAVLQEGHAPKRRVERLDKIAEVSKGNVALGTEQKFAIIYADPPWKYDHPSGGSESRAIENQYPTMTLAEICALPVGDLATNDALLFMWATSPKLYESMKVLDAWGFEYKTSWIWDKVKIGPGYYVRSRHELLLIAKRGNIPPLETGKQPPSIYVEKSKGHSAKPAFFGDTIARHYPQLPKIELFARSPREGWAVWGNQASPEAEGGG